MRSRVVQPGMTFEYMMWLFTRISGITMILLALIGFVGALIMEAHTQTDLPTLMRWTFFPNPNHVVASDIPDIDQGWATGIWKIMQLLLIYFAGTHAWNGLRVILEDYIGPSGVKIAVRSLIFFLWLASMIMATYLILTSWVS